MQIQRDAQVGRWTVIGELERGNPKVLCRCECGTEREVSRANLTQGLTLSCGCLKRERTTEVHRTHGTGYENYRYNLWRSIKKRCFAPAHFDYPHYGGRGITMHEPWISDFAAFAAWIDANLGPRPERHTLDRIDNDGNYEPGNLRWATRGQQARNRRLRADGLWIAKE